jgi:hypothetical protein
MTVWPSASARSKSSVLRCCPTRYRMAGSWKMPTLFRTRLHELRPLGGRDALEAQSPEFANLWDAHVPQDRAAKLGHREEQGRFQQGEPHGGERQQRHAQHLLQARTPGLRPEAVVKYGEQLLHDRVGGFPAGFEGVEADDWVSPGFNENDLSVRDCDQWEEIVRGLPMKVNKQERNPLSVELGHDPQQGGRLAAAGATGEEGVLRRPARDAEWSPLAAYQRLSCTQLQARRRAR